MALLQKEREDSNAERRSNRLALAGHRWSSMEQLGSSDSKPFQRVEMNFSALPLLSTKSKKNA